MINIEKQIHTELLASIEDKKRKIDTASMTNMVDAAHWLGDKSRAYELYDHYVEKYVKTKKLKVNPQLLSELVMGIAWSNKKNELTLEETRDEIFNKYHEATEKLTNINEIGFDRTYAVDIAVLAENYSIPVDQVIELIKKIKEEPRIVATNARFWSTAITIASAVMAEEMDENKVIETYVEVDSLTGGKESETVCSALFQAALLSSPKEAVEKYKSLKSKKIAKSWLLKKEIIEDGSKAFLVLAMIIGNKSETDIIATIQSLIDSKLKQDSATRLILADANKDAENPVLCRQGSFEITKKDQLKLGPKYDPLAFPFIDYMPILGDPKSGEIALYVEDETVRYYYSVALRLTSKKNQ
ncbi:MAG: hypothetical protein IT416_00200 [Candidatus Pacebacteria bacterium]|nr:hypothetical protein [Candidatus Paceibacterota bacterium]